jgi:hypothetical protein
MTKLKMLTVAAIAAGTTSLVVLAGTVVRYPWGRRAARAR